MAHWYETSGRTGAGEGLCGTITVATADTAVPAVSVVR